MPAPDELLIEPACVEGNQADVGRDPANSDISAWLHWLSDLLPTARCIALVRVNDSGTPVALIRSPGSPPLPAAAMALVSRACRQGSRQRLRTEAPDELVLALPAPRDGNEAVASSALLLISSALTPQQQSTMVGLASWALRSLAWADRSDTPVGPGLCNRRAMVEPHGIQYLLDQLSSHHEGAQCALVWMKRGRRGRYKARVVAMSGQPKVDPSRTAVRKLAMLMQDMLAEQSQLPLPVYGPADSDTSGDPVSAVNQTPSCSRFVVPVKVRDELFMISLLRTAGQEWSVATREQMLQEWVPAFQSAWMLRELEAPLHEIGWRRVLIRFAQCRSRRIATLVQATLLVFALALVLVPVDKRVSAEVHVEAAERHALIAPMDGFVKSIHARAGDRVARGDLLATLDGDDLLRQADKWEAEEQKNQQDYLGALAVHDRVELSSLRESRLLIQTELEQVRAQLARHELRAPIAGMVLSDSVEDALGSAVKAGQILFEVGSAEQYRLALQVPERRISDIAVGQRVSLRMTADPRQRRQARVEMVIPMATASQGQNTFKVYALPDGQAGVLRPGMKGVGKVLVGRASRLRQWTGSLWARCVWLAWKLGLSR